MDIPTDAIALNFVVQFYEHFDNNMGSDYKVGCSLHCISTNALNADL